MHPKCASFVAFLSVMPLSAVADGSPVAHVVDDLTIEATIPAGGNDACFTSL